MSHLDELDEFEAELELRLKREYTAVFGLFRYCILTQDATYLCNKLDVEALPQASYPFFHVRMHVVQLTPPGSGCSIVIGDHPSQNQMAPGSLKAVQLVVSDAVAAREELRSRGVEVSELTLFDERDGGTFFGFSDPDGNSWAVQEIRARAGRPLIPPDARRALADG